MIQERKPELKALTGVRFFAAFHVVMFHAIHGRGYLSSRVDKDGWFYRIFDSGYVSVSLFFILSGFILTYNYSDRAEAFDRQRFWAARFARIYPVYVTGFLVAAPLAVMQLFQLKTLPTALALLGIKSAMFLTLVQSWMPNAALMWNPPSWSLSVEAFFYLTFPFLLPLLRKLPRHLELPLFVCMWFCMLAPALAHSWLKPDGAGSADTGWVNSLKFFPLLRLPEFVMGMLLGSWFLRDGKPSALFGFVAGGAFVALVGLLAWASRVPYLVMHNGLLDPLFALLLFALCKTDRGMFRVLSTPAFTYLGESSYALYILHLPMLMWFEILCGKLGFVEPSVPLFLGYLLTTIAVSCLCFSFIEHPLRSRIVRWLTRSASAGTDLRKAESRSQNLP